MLVREIMTSPAHKVDESASLEEALQTLVTARVTSLPVVDGGGRLVGIISEADVLREHLAPDPRAHIRPFLPDSDPLPTTSAPVVSVPPPPFAGAHNCPRQPPASSGPHPHSLSV